MDIKVYGPGCANCRATAALIGQVLRERGIAATVSKVEDLRQIAAAGVMSTPGVSIDGALVHAGGVPSRAAVERWLVAAAPSCGAAAS